MLYDPVLIEYSIQNVQRPSAANHEIFGYDFKPVDDWLARENVLVMRRPQANPNPVLRKAVEPVRRHAIFLSYGRRKEGQEEFPSPPHLTAPDFELLLRGFGVIRS